MTVPGLISETGFREVVSRRAVRNEEGDKPGAEEDRRDPPQGGAIQDRVSGSGDLEGSARAAQVGTPDGRRKEWLSNWRAAEEFAAEQNKKIEEANGKTAKYLQRCRRCLARAIAKDVGAGQKTKVFNRAGA